MPLLNILMYFIYFFYVFYDFCCLRSSFGSISSWINDIQSKKRTKLLIYRPKWKIHFAIFLYTKWINSHFRVDLWSQKVMWLHNGRSDFRKLGVKISARLQRKKSWSGAAESMAVLCARQNLSRGDASEAHPPSAVRVKKQFLVMFVFYIQNWNNAIKEWKIYSCMGLSGVKLYS